MKKQLILVFYFFHLLIAKNEKLTLEKWKKKTKRNSIINSVIEISG